MVGGMKCLVVVAVLMAIVTCILKITRPDSVVLNRRTTILSVCWHGGGLAVLMVLYLRWAWRVVYSLYTKKHWSARRWKAIQVLQLKT